MSNLTLFNNSHLIRFTNTNKLTDSNLNNSTPLSVCDYAEKICFIAYFKIC